MKTEHLHCLRVIAQCGSINKASKILYTSQPGLSSIIASLEKELGAPLVERSKKGITLTPLGQKVVADSEEILNFVSSWSDFSTANSVYGVTGKVRIGTFNMAGNVILPDVVIRTLDEHPNISVECCTIPQYNLLQYINNDAIDIGIIGLTPTNLSVSEQISKNRHWQYGILYKEDYNIFVSTKNPLAREAEITVENALSCELPIVYNLTEGFFNEFSYLDEIIESHEPSMNIKMNSFSAAMAIVAQNRAIAMYPGFGSIDNYYIATGKVTCVPLSNTSFTCLHGLISRRNKYRSRAESIIIKYITEIYTQHKIHAQKNIPE